MERSRRANRICNEKENRMTTRVMFYRDDIELGMHKGLEKNMEAVI